GIELLMRENPDVAFFTGDLVKDETAEMRNWVNVFEKLKAPLGVFSVTGNHDYGDYRQWSSPAAKKRNFEDLKRVHANMGWNLLMNQHHLLKQGGEQLAIIGVENWGAIARFPQYGRLEEARKGTEDAAVKLLLSHDPSHWRAQVLPEFSDIDATFSGHTHGMQFGVRFKQFQWSPAQYVYPEWDGLYREGGQQLYVNAGYGFLGYPGRVGMRPVIAIFELDRGYLLDLREGRCHVNTDFPVVRFPGIQQYLHCDLFGGAGMAFVFAAVQGTRSRSTGTALFRNRLRLH